MKENLKVQHFCSTFETTDMGTECRLHLPFESKREESQNLRLTGLSFRHRLTLLVLASILVPVILASLLAFISFDQQLKTKLASQLTAEQKIFSLQLDHRHDDLIKGLARVVADNTLQVTLALGIDAQLGHYLQQQMAPLGFSGLGIVDLGSQLIARQGQVPEVCLVSADPLMIDRARGELCMRAPIFKNGSQIGTAIASISIGGEEFLRQLKADLKSHLFLLIDGNPVLSEFTSALPLGDIMALREGELSEVKIGGENYIAQIGSREYCGRSALLGTLVLKSREYTSYWNVAAKITGVLLLVVLLLVIVMRKFVAGLLRPISRLTDAARQVEQGDAQLFQLDCRRTDELGVLNRAFVKMATSQQRYAEQLEKKVAERTVALTQLNRALEEDIKAREEAEYAKERLEQQLFQTQKMDAIGTMAGGIAHDINNTLVPIFAYTEMVMRKIPEEDKNYGRLTKVRLAANRCRDLVSQILMFSRQGATDKSVLQPHLVIQETAKLLRASTPSTVNIIVEIDENCGHILANESQIHQIILNLCTNAVQAMNQQGTLEIRLQKIERSSAQTRLKIPFAQIEVSDTGHGMSEDVQKRIFEPFFTTKEVGKGTGMGLSVVHGIVRSHGGEILCDSSLDKGTRFKVCLPLLGAEAHLPALPLEIIGPLEGDERVLLLDDEVEITASWAEYLREYGYHTTCVNSVSEALTLLQEAEPPFNLLVSDQTMPQKTGLQFALELSCSYPDLPILLCSGDRSGLDGADVQATSIREVLSKPLAGSELIASIRRIFPPTEG
ncbi:MAG: ATP-binding protein [Geopsychrobacter sp.]|nr:ATP-binding protein [Geopsychrobacter sp.]